MGGSAGPAPVLDLRFFRLPQFSTANIAAFRTYFGTFAIFFFTALYLVWVAAPPGSGWRWPSCRWQS
jgi:hypothetical protein